MPRVFIPSIPPSEIEQIELKGDEAAYVINVLRMSQGESLELFDSKGGRATAKIQSIKRGIVNLDLTERKSSPTESKGNIVLLQGILKAQKMDLVIQKSTELGVKSIIPIVTERTEVKETRKVERWRKIAIEASRQCGRPWVPDVQGPLKFDDYFKSKSGLSGFIFWESGGAALTASDIQKGKDIIAAIGPEGGFTEAEVRLAADSGLKIVNLGPIILRAETAAIVSVALLRYLSGGFQAV